MSHKHHIRIYFDDDEVLHIEPKDSIGAMALRHYATKLALHGAKMLDVHTEVYEEPSTGVAVVR